MLDLRILAARIEAARERYSRETVIEHELFDRRYSGETADTQTENFNRWIDQHTRLMDALNEYQAAVSAYVEASRRPL